MKTVDIIASGYEWECPVCEFPNNEISVTPEVKCHNCEEIFKVENYFHAID